MMMFSSKFVLYINFYEWNICKNIVVKQRRCLNLINGLHTDKQYRNWEIAYCIIHTNNEPIVKIFFEEYITYFKTKLLLYPYIVNVNKQN